MISSLNYLVVLLVAINLLNSAVARSIISNQSDNDDSNLMSILPESNALPSAYEEDGSYFNFNNDDNNDALDELETLRLLNEIKVYIFLIHFFNTLFFVCKKFESFFIYKFFFIVRLNIF